MTPTSAERERDRQIRNLQARSRMPEQQAGMAGMQQQIAELTAALAAVRETVTAVAGKHQVAALATGTVPLALLLGGSTSVVVPWPPGVTFPLPYRVDFVMLTGLLGKATPEVTAYAATSITVKLTATLAIAAGAQFVVLGTYGIG